MGIMSGIVFWLLVWILVSVPVSLVLAQLLKAPSEPCQCEAVRRPSAGYGAGPRLPSERMAPLGASPAVGG